MTETTAAGVPATLPPRMGAPATLPPPVRSMWQRLLGQTLIVASLVLLFAPGYLFPKDQFWLGLFAKYMTLALLALSVDLVWGYTGLLSLGQGLFFGLGAYMVAYSLTLQEAAKSEHVKVGKAAPQFMAYTNVAPNDPAYVEPAALKWITPLGDLRVAVVMAVLLPTLVGLLFGLFTFRPCVRSPGAVGALLAVYLACLAGVGYLWRVPLSGNPIAGVVLVTVLSGLFVLGLVISGARIGGVYFSLVTQALLMVVFTLVRSQQRYTGGVVGIKDLADFKLFGMTFDLNEGIIDLNYLAAGILSVSFLACSWLVNSKFGRVLTAIRDSEFRVQALGYNTALFKTFAFAFAGGLAGLAGALYLASNELCGPGYLSVEFSIEAVIWVAIGGRGTLLGAVAGTLLVGFLQSFISSAFPDYWPIILGALFILAVLFLRDGIYAACRRATLLTVMLGLLLSHYVDDKYGEELTKRDRMALRCGCILGMVLLPAAVALLGRWLRTRFGQAATRTATVTA